MKPLSVFVAVLTAFVLLSTPALAADEPNPELTDIKIESAVFKELFPARLAAQFGVAESFKTEGHLLLAVRIGVTPVWTEELDKVRIDAKDIKIILDGGGEVPMIGYFEQIGMFTLGTNSFSEYRPYKWKEIKEVEFHNAVFAIPEGTKSVEYKCGDISKKIDVTAPLDAPDPAMVVDFEVMSAKLVDRVETKFRAGKMEPSPRAVLSNPFGKILELKLKIQPKRGNGNDPNHFFWKTEWMSLKLDNGRFVPVLGQFFMDKVENGVSNNLNRSTEGDTFRGDEKTMYFAVPADMGKFTLMYLNRPKAEGQI